MVEYLPNGQPVPKKRLKKKPPLTPRAGTEGRGGVAPYVPKQTAKPRPQLPQTARAFPFKDFKTSNKYARETKRLVDMFGIQINGLESHKNPNELYVEIGNAIHRLPTAAIGWLEDKGSKVTINVTKDGTIAFRGSGADKGSKAAGLYTPFTDEIVVGSPRDSAYGVSNVFAHEFAHWLDEHSDTLLDRARNPRVGKAMSKRTASTGTVSGDNPSVFGNVASFDAPHGERRWERFAISVASYVGSEESRASLKPGVIKFLDRFLGPQLGADSQDGNGRKYASRKVVRRAAAIKKAYMEGFFALPASDFEALLKTFERRMERDERE